MDMNTTLNFSIFDDNFTTTAAPNRGGPPSIQPGVYTDAKELIWKIVPPIVIILGTFGNTLTILVLLRQVMNLSSTAVYLLSLAVSDLLLLYLGPLRQWIQYIWDVDVRLLTDAGCKIQVFLTYFSVHFSSWLLVAVTLERVISVMLPHKVKLNCTTMKAGIVVAVTFVCLFLLNVHFFFGYGLVHKPLYVRAPWQCTPINDDYMDFRDDILPWLDFVVAFLLPFTILTVGNVMIIVKLRINTVRRRKMSLTQKEKEGRSVTFMLIALCVIFFICLTPVSIFLIILPYLREEAMKLPYVEMIRQMEYLIFWHAVTNCFGYINSSTNFILYFLSGSRFRSEVRHLFTCKHAGKEGVFGNSSSGSGRSTSLTKLGTSIDKKATEVPKTYAVIQKDADEGVQENNINESKQKTVYENKVYESDSDRYDNKAEKEEENFTNIIQDGTNHKTSLEEEERQANGGTDINTDKL